MNLHQTLRNIDVFADLTGDELEQVAAICHERRFEKGETLVQEGAPGDTLFIIMEGFVEVILEPRGGAPARVVVSLGSGQVIGEMALLDHGPRSASVQAISNPTVVQAIQSQDFVRLCQKNTRIGYLVMHNLAVDLSFKLRHRNLSER